MTTDQYVAAFSAAMSFFGFLVVAFQLRDNTAQRKLESQIRLYDINRELISLGFSHPQLFEVLKDAEGVDATVERRYLQLWLNQLSLIHAFKGRGVFGTEYQKSCEADLRDMMSMSNMQRQWRGHGEYYPASFQKSVNDILRETGNTELAAVKN